MLQLISTTDIENAAEDSEVRNLLPRDQDTLVSKWIRIVIAIMYIGLLPYLIYRVIYTK